SKTCSIGWRIFSGMGIFARNRNQNFSNGGSSAIAAAPVNPMMANGLEALESQPAWICITSRTIELTEIKVIGSTNHSESAVVRTKALLMPERRLIIKVRITSPARAGRTLFPRYPAEVAQNANGTETCFRASSKTRQR